MCPRHMNVKFPSVATTCYFNDCEKSCTGRPSKLCKVPERAFPFQPPPQKVYLKVSPKKKSPVKVCAWHRCNELALPKRKYCSKACSNKNARKAYRERKKLERKDDQ